MELVLETPTYFDPSHLSQIGHNLWGGELLCWIDERYTHMQQFLISRFFMEDSMNSLGTCGQLQDSSSIEFMVFG